MPNLRMKLLAALNSALRRNRPPRTSARTLASVMWVARGRLRHRRARVRSSVNRLKPRDRAVRLRGGNLFGAEFDLAAFGRLRAEDRFDQLGPPRPGEPRDADDLARARFKTHILELRRAGQRRHPQFDLADAACPRREYLFQFAPGHMPDHLVGAYLAPRPRVNGPPVAQYGQPVGDLRQFFQTVRNIDDGQAS